jgi:hypothetical protein
MQNRQLDLLGQDYKEQSDKMEKAIRDALTFDCLTVYVRRLLRESLPEGGDE